MHVVRLLPLACFACLQGASTWETRLLVNAGEPKQPEHPGLDSASESADEDAMSETEDEEAPRMPLEDERKLMRSVLSQFDDGAAKTELQDAKPPTGVGYLKMTLQCYLQMQRCI